jgi:hypothetical protein
LIDSGAVVGIEKKNCNWKIGYNGAGKNEENVHKI